MSPQLLQNLLSVKEGGGGWEHRSLYVYKDRENWASLLIYC